jgi:undecaprenyl phosphate-alpha-L-ara4N flippase subunit ArnE
MKIVLTYVVMISLTVIANLLLKIGAVAEDSSKWLGLVNGWIVGGLAAFGTSALFYILILKWLPLHVAQSFAAMQFIAVILAASLVLQEPITPLRWIGIAIIFIGILVVSQSWSEGS